VLRSRQFRIYFMGCTASNIGTWLQTTAQVLYAYRITHSAFDVGVISCAQFSGFLTIGPWAASVANRLGRKRVLLGTQALSAVVAGGLAAIQIAGRLTESELVLGALGTGLAFAFALPVQTTLASTLVPEKDRKAALAMNSVSYNLGRTLAPLLCLGIMASIGSVWAFALNSMSFIIFFITILIVYTGGAKPEVERAHAWAGFLIAIRWPRVMLLLAMVAAITLADDPILVLGPSVAQRLGVPSIWPAYFLSALGVGTVLGAMIPIRSVDPLRQARRAALPLAILSTSIVVFALGLSPLTSLLAAATAGITGLLTGSTVQALLLRTVGSRHAMQVMALWAIAWAGSKPIASLADGWLAANLGPVAAAIVLATPAMMVALPELLLPKKHKDPLKRYMHKINYRAHHRSLQSSVM